VPNMALCPEHFTVLRKYTHLPFIAHLELGNPEQVVDGFPSLNAEEIIVQWDTVPFPLRVFKKIKQRGARVGLSLNPADSLADITECLMDIDTLLILGVVPGFGGQPMAPGTVEKVAAARKLTDSINPKIRIAVDGGVNKDNARYLVQAGIDSLIIGTALFTSTNPTEYVAQIKTYPGK
jgi:ribulose-phosphate 3-epimerase